MTAKTTVSSDRIHVGRVPSLGNLELLRARHINQSFPRHTHDQYAIGVIEAGALGFHYRREHWVAPAGSINVCIPGEVHTGHAMMDEGWTYRMFYLGPELLRQIASEITGSPHDIPYFKPGVIHDSLLANQINQLHTKLERQNAMLMEIEAEMLALLVRMIIRYADARFPLQPVGAEPQAVARVKDYLQAHYAEDISLDELSRLTHVSRFHLLRVFQKAIGIPPHAYLRQVRVQRAKTLLAQDMPGITIAGIAAVTGFTDQSHMTKWFKRLWGFTPGEYRNSVLYRRDNKPYATGRE